MEIVGVGVFGAPGRRRAGRDGRRAGRRRTGSAACGPGRPAVEHAGAEQRRELGLVEAPMRSAGIGVPALRELNTPFATAWEASESVVQAPRRSANTSADRANLMPLNLTRDRGRLRGRPGVLGGGLSCCATCTIAATPSTGTIRLRIGMVPRKTMTMPVSHSTPVLLRRHARLRLGEAAQCHLLVVDTAGQPAVDTVTARHPGRR